MRSNYLLFILGISLGFHSCNCRKDTASGKNMIENSGTTSSPSGNNTSGNTGVSNIQSESWTRDKAAQGPDSFRLVVTFISIGAGTDPDAKTFLDSYIIDYRTRTGNSPKYIMIPWGREGEVDCCFNLTELSASEQTAFIEGLRNRMKGRELIQINENAKNRFKP